MITFKNIAGNKFLAVGTIQRKSALNGEKSLTGTLYDGDDVLNKIDKGWSLEFDNEPYIVTYFERNDNDNSVSFDAIHKFFWDMAKNVLYSETSGSHTIKWYLDQIFANTGYSYALNFNPNAIAKDNWGMKNKLSLFNDVITSIEGEFEINGTLVSIFKNIGTDLSTIVRYGFNLSDMTIENDASGFVTYGEGFGAYADQENMTGDRLHVTYTSPLASVYGKLQAEPIDDQRYTIESNLLDAVKFQVDTSFSISVNLSLYDLSVAGYPYKMANVGDWLTAVDENLDFKQRIRIISIDDEFAADGTRISYSVTAGDIGLTKKYQDANASIANKVEDAVISAGQAATDANIALIAANGKNKSYHLNDINDLPKTANEGDLAWVQSGDGRVLYIYTKKADGTYYWEKRIDPEMGEQIEAGVNEAIAQANENTATAIEENNISQQEVMNDIAKSQADLAIKDGDFNNKAQAMADKALSDAKANTAVVAKETLDTATDNLNTAKQSLTADLQKEVSDRTTAVATLDSKAQGYADSAKQDAIAAATTADGTINKKIDETASSLTSKITQNKQDADGKITTAQSTATQALNEVKTKVSQTEYNTKTGQLTTDVNSVTQTANQSKQDIVSINQKDGQQDSRMNTIESDANGTKQTVSQLQAVQGQQSGSISTLQQRADGFDATVTKVDNLAVGGRNLLVNSKLLTFTNGNNVATTTTKVAYDATTNMWHITSPKGGSGNAGIYFSQSVVTKGQSWSLSFDIKGTGVYSDKHIGVEASAPFNSPTGNVPSDWTRISSNGVANGSNPVIIYFNSLNTALDVYIKLPKLESGNIPTDWTPAPEDVDSATAKAQLTADQATTALNNYKINADGRITKAQSDITQTAKDVTTKVSQTDYNAKTGDLDTRVTKAQTTADGVATTVGAYKTSNDNRIKATETSIAQNTKDITLRATSTDLDSAKKDYNAQIAQVKVNADSITSQVSSIQTKINSMGQVNQLANTEFNPDMSGWYGSTLGSSSDPIKNAVDSSHVTALQGQGYSSSNAVLFDTTDQASQFYARLIQYVPVTGGTSVSMSWYVKTLTYGTYTNMWITFWDKNGKDITNGGLYVNWSKGKVTNQWDYMTLPSLTNIKVPDTAVTMRISMESREGVKQLMSRFMVVFDSTVGDYVPGAYNSNDKVAVQQVTIDGITDTVSKQGTNIDSVTKRVTTAEGTLSTATNNISGLQSSVTQTSNQIKTEISDRTKGDSNTLQSSKDFTTSSITSYDKGVQSQFTQTANGIIANIGATNLFPNSEFTQDYYRSKSGTVTYLANQNVDNQYHGIVRVVTTAASYQGYWAKNIPVTGGKKYSASVKVHFTNNGLTSGRALLDLWFIDKSGNRVGSASRDTSQVSSPYWIDLVNDGFTAPINAAYMQMSLIINNAGAGMTADFTMPTFTATDVHQPYTPNDDVSAQLSLFKDNWSIGIADNIGNITSGIVGNSGSMSLISKNIVLDGDTTVTGTFKVSQANIANGSIGTAQIGDAAITSAKIANLDVSKITGDITNFIQSNWNGIYGSTTITSSGMTIISPGIVALFNVNGMTLDGAGGMTRVANGFTQIYSATHENIGMIGHQKDVDHDNVDYITFGLNGYRTTNDGDSHWVGGSDFYGGDGMGFGVSNKKGTYDLKLRWDSDLIAGYKGEIQGWHASDAFIFDNKTYHKGYADFSAGVTMSGSYSEGTRSLHTQGMSISTGAKWFGFMDGSNSTGFGTDQTQDVLFYVKGQVYSLYTMLGKLGMR
ncbi:phage tail protein [Leuconostoc mesenteroides]|uniref:phage tail protein n=1 Tax=Leuconostoc mesenteroides TaxID=1245 RepID=UPI003AF8AB03